MIEQCWAIVPGRAYRLEGDIVAVARRNRNGGHRLEIQPLGEMQIVRNDPVKDLTGEIDEINLIDGEHN